MGLSFLSPEGALVALALVVPALAFVALERRGARVRRSLGLGAPRMRTTLAPLVALAAVVGLIAAAAAEPVLERASARSQRTDAEAFFVFDISRSMLAAAGPDAPTRLERAREAAHALRAAIPEVPAGIASFTDRALPHLFPTADQGVFAATLERSLAIERPPPVDFYAHQATSLAAVSALPRLRYFSPEARRRLMVVFTDGETNPVSADALARAFARRPRIATVYVHVWDADERVYTTSLPEPGYRPAPGSRAELARVAAATGGRAFSEHELEDVRAAAERALGDGPLRRGEGDDFRLAPYVTLAALLPLAFLLRRRNV